jgi:ubiquinone/menaquinone biosynthesis C-methylase UbiE
METAFQEARLRAAPADPGDDALAGRLAAAAGDVRGLRALDAGCGTGQLARAFAAAGARVAALDACAGALARAEGPGRVRGDAARLPFRDRAFDLAACSLVLHYTGHPGRCLGELGRVLRPAGRLLLADRIVGDDPAAAELQRSLERRRNPELGRLLSAREIEAAVRDAGFAVEAASDASLSRTVESWIAGSSEEGPLRHELQGLGTRDLGGLRLDRGTVTLRVRLLSAIRR